MVCFIHLLHASLCRLLKVSLWRGSCNFVESMQPRSGNELQDTEMEDANQKFHLFEQDSSSPVSGLPRRYVGELLSSRVFIYSRLSPIQSEMFAWFGLFWLTSPHHNSHKHFCCALSAEQHWSYFAPCRQGNGSHRNTRHWKNYVSAIFAPLSGRE